MSKTLVTFGDSWPAGGGNKPRAIPFGKLIADELGYNFENYAEDATSIPHMILQLQQYIKDNRGSHPTALFCLTTSARSIYYNPDELEHMGWCEIHISNTDEASKQYYKHLYSKQLGYFHANVYLAAIQHMCLKNKIKDRYVFCWETFDLMPGIDSGKIYGQTLADIIGANNGKKVKTQYEVNVDPYNEFVKPNNNHPNQKGHQKIADVLAKWIETV